MLLPMHRRIRFAVGHFALSAAVVGTFLLLVHFVWYPSPLGRLEGVFFILALVVVVDVCLGPLLTLIVAAPSKPWRSLARDLAIIGAVQIAALGYGAYSAFVVRPAFLVFNADRFDVVTPGELVWRDGRRAADPQFQATSLTGPVWAHALAPTNETERVEMILAAAQGGPDLKNLPDLFHPWPAPRAVESVRARLQPLDKLTALGETHRAAVESALQRSGVAADDAAYVPLIARESTGVVMLRRSDLSIVGVLAVAPRY